MFHSLLFNGPQFKAYIRKYNRDNIVEGDVSLYALYVRTSITCNPTFIIHNQIIYLTNQFFYWISFTYIRIFKYAKT